MARGIVVTMHGPKASGKTTAMMKIIEAMSNEYKCIRVGRGTTADGIIALSQDYDLIFIDDVPGRS